MKSTTRVHILLRNSWTGATESTKAVSPVQVPTIRHAAMQDVEFFFFGYYLLIQGCKRIKPNRIYSGLNLV